jgi:acyl dehydratase
LAHRRRAGRPAASRRRLPQSGSLFISPQTTVSRYAAATGDDNAVHLDDAAARRAGFPGVIAPGLGVLGLVTSALVRMAGQGEAQHLSRVRARFSGPVRPGSDLTLSSGVHGDLLSFSALDPAGTAVLRDGWARLR